LFQSGQPAASAALASIIVAAALPVILIARRTLARRALSDDGILWRKRAADGMQNGAPVRRGERIQHETIKPC
jgi:hypothetical protein